MDTRKTNREKEDKFSFTERYGEGFSVSRDIDSDPNKFIKSDEPNSPDYDVRVISPLD